MTIKEMFNKVKFKTIRNLVVSESVIPAKGNLIKICKEQYNVSHSQLKLSGLQSLKDRVILAIYMAEKVKTSEKDLVQKFR